MGKREETETGPKFRTVTVGHEVYEELETLRRREQEELGLPELSWNNFFARMLKFLRESKAKK